LRRSDCFSSSYLGEASRASSAHFEPKVGISAPAPFLALRDASPIDEIRRHGERPMKASRAFPSAHSDQSSLHFWRFTMPRWAWRKVSEASRPEFPRAFGLRTPAPLWTAPAFDRCLLLALIYPIATIFIIWAVSGHVGPAEHALGFKSDVQGWLRGFAVASLLFASFALLRAVRMEGWKSLASSVGVAFFVALAVTFADVDAVAGAGAFAFALVVTVAGTVAGAVAFVFAVTFGVAGAGPLAFAGAIAFAAAAAVAGAVMVLSVTAIKQRWQGLFLALFLPAMIVACLGAAELLSVKAGPLLLFLGLLTLLNAPFDWASLGLTRALPRRGLELGGWWPYFLAIVDGSSRRAHYRASRADHGGGRQAFDELAVHGGGEQAAVLPLDKLFDGIAKNPAAPEYWWAYALLLSSMIPSLINLMISGMAFHARDSVAGAASFAMDSRGQSRAGVQAATGGHRFDGTDVRGRRSRHRGAGAPRLGPHFPCHAVDWPRPAQHGPRDCHF
jgi:hypothetical protein